MLLLATIDKGILWPFVSYPSRGTIQSFLPMGEVCIRISFHVIFDVISSRVSLWIASDTLFVRVLVNPDIVETESGRHQSCKTSEVELRKTCGHTKVHDDGHWLHRDGSLSDIAIGTDRTCIQFPNRLVRHVPYDIARFSRLVVEVVLLIAFPIIPGVIDIGQARQRLLENTPLV